MPHFWIIGDPIINVGWVIDDQYWLLPFINTHCDGELVARKTTPTTKH